MDYERLKRYQIPDVTKRIAKRDAIFYALSIGLGQDAMDERQLDFVDHHRALKVMPSMAVVLGHPGRWLVTSNTGVDGVRVVHGEESIDFVAPLPPEGEFTGKTRITGIVDKGADKGALVYSERKLFDVATGALLAVIETTAFLRGDGGFGGPAGPVKAPSPMPDSPPDIVVDLPTRTEQALYYRLNEDDNPLHADPKVAAKAGYPRPILHGLCTLGVVCHALVRTMLDYDAPRLKSMKLRFSSPVLPGETIRTEIWRNGAFRARVVERDKVVVDNGLAHFAGA
jgi:acyl dehydratase